MFHVECGARQPTVLPNIRIIPFPLPISNASPTTMLLRHPIVTFITTALACSQSLAFTTCHSFTRCDPTLHMAAGFSNNQQRSITNEEIGGVNGAPIYESYEIEDRGQFMQRVEEERKTLRDKKASDLLEVARIAGIELKRKESDPNKLDLFDAEDLIGGDDDYLDVSV